MLPAADLRVLTLPAIVDLWVLDASAEELGGDVLYFHNYDTESNPSFDGQEYSRWPIGVQGFERTTGGALPRPRLTVANIGAAITSILRVSGDLVGARLRRIRTFAKYLDGAPDADPTAILQTEEWVVNQKLAESETAVEFELAAICDVEGVMLPREQVSASGCRHVYRGGDGCPYAGAPVSRRDGTAFSGTLTSRGEWAAGTYAPGDYVYQLVNGIRRYYVQIAASSSAAPLTDATVWARDMCPKTTAGCKQRFGATGVLPRGAFPGAARVPRVR
ncbi:MAG: phage minor tail protein L [Verrucomicrobia bacterium]|nr:phage minor tail protein L [Verrucomicrobiota bacterium]